MSKTVLVTGSSRGIGRATAIAFAKEGWNVVINYNRSRVQAEQLEDEIIRHGGKVAIAGCDVANRKQVDNMVRKAYKAFGKIDVLVNNAGIAQQKLFTDITVGEWDEMFDVNVKGMFNCCQAVLPKMISDKQGKIISVSSMWGITGGSCEVHYSAAKAAIIGFTRALAKEVGPSGITVNCVAPGVIATDMNGNLSIEDLDALKKETPLERIGMPEDIANAIMFLASEKADFITGQVIGPNGGILI
jgi:3-oxoacyl-[acyl-carrier protein] reductase